ncbi:MAG: exosortase-associated EpsI family protein [Victivallales bacterium]|nr:exosortase-associated EpsI family protein [Victivallales bacterium]
MILAWYRRKHAPAEQVPGDAAPTPSSPAEDAHAAQKDAPAEQVQAPPQPSPLRYALLTPALLLLALGYFRHINLALLLGGILLPMTLAGIFFSVRLLRLLLPGCGVLALFCPGIGIWLSTFLPMDGFLLKLLLALILTLLFPLLTGNLLTRLPLEKTIFCATALLLAAGYWSNGQFLTRQPPLLPRFDSLLSPNFRGILESANESDRQFFGNSNIRRYIFQDAGNHPFQVLAVSEIDNIHNVHSILYCIRVGGYRILSDASRSFPADGDLPPLHVQEILAEHHGEKTLFWQWYSTPAASTHSFLLFRMLYSPKDNWSVFICSTPVRDSLEASQKQLRTFLHDFLHVKRVCEKHSQNITKASDASRPAPAASSVSPAEFY